MWLARSLPPLLSHLRRPASARGGSVLSAGSSNQILSHSRACTSAGANNLYRDPADGAAAPAQTCSSSSSSRPHLCSCFGANQLVQRPRRDLYIVLDDWKNGFSLYKLSLDDLLAGGDNAGVAQQRLPDPILRLGFLMVGSYPRFHALGSNIVATSTSNSFSGDGSFTLVYDTETAELHTEQSLPNEVGTCYDAVATGNKLYTFNSCSNNGGLLYLCQTEYGISRFAGATDDDDDDVPYCMRPQPRWAWKSGPAPPPPCAHSISARALHPDGRTIFVSFRNNYAKEMGTYTLDTESGEWKHRGDWCLPFRGQAHYDADIDAWVGTHTVKDEHGRGYGHLCSCDVPALDDGGPTPAPAWKVEADRLTFLEPSVEFKFRPVLLHMGCCGTFCLVERALRPGVTFGRSMGSGDNCLLRVTIFRAKYGKNGELVAVPIWYGRTYHMSRYVANYDMSAFWI